MAALPLMILAALLALGGPAPKRPIWTQTARANLGFSGAILSVTSVGKNPKRPWIGRRIVKLTEPNGARRFLPLTDAGGYAGDFNLNLYHISKDRFLLAGERDCVEIDPIRGRLSRCVKARICPKTGAYLGRFDWMNGFDPPRGAFRLGFRYLPAYDAGESGGC